MSCHLLILTHYLLSMMVQLGSRLIELLIDTAYIQIPTTQSADSPPDVRPAFRHKFKILNNDQG